MSIHELLERRNYLTQITPDEPDVIKRLFQYQELVNLEAELIQAGYLCGDSLVAMYND